jgi:hypothetical protein
LPEENWDISLPILFEESRLPNFSEISFGFPSPSINSGLLDQVGAKNFARISLSKYLELAKSLAKNPPLLYEFLIKGVANDTLWNIDWSDGFIHQPDWVRFDVDSFSWLTTGFPFDGTIRILNNCSLPDHEGTNDGNYVLINGDRVPLHKIPYFQFGYLDSRPNLRIFVYLPRLYKVPHWRTFINYIRLNVIWPSIVASFPSIQLAHIIKMHPLLATESSRNPGGTFGAESFFLAKEYLGNFLDHFYSISSKYNVMEGMFWRVLGKDLKLSCSFTQVPLPHQITQSVCQCFRADVLANNLYPPFFDIAIEMGKANMTSFWVKSGTIALLEALNSPMARRHLDEALLTEILCGARSELNSNMVSYINMYTVDKELGYQKALQTIPHVFPDDVLNLSPAFLGFLSRKLKILDLTHSLAPSFPARIEFRINANQLGAFCHPYNMNSLLALLSSRGFICHVPTVQLMEFKALKLKAWYMLANLDRRSSIAHLVSYLVHSLDSRPWDSKAWLLLRDEFNIQSLSSATWSANFLVPLEPEWNFKSDRHDLKNFWKFTKYSLLKKPEDEDLPTVARPSEIRQMTVAKVSTLIEPYLSQKLTVQDMFHLYTKNICSLVPAVFQNEDCPDFFLSAVLAHRHLQNIEIVQPPRVKWESRIAYLLDLDAKLPRKGTHWCKLYCHLVLQNQMQRYPDEKDSFMKELWGLFTNLELLPLFHLTAKLWQTKQGKLLLHLNEAIDSRATNHPIYVFPFDINQNKWLSLEQEAMLYVASGSFLQHFSIRTSQTEMNLLAAVSLVLYEDEQYHQQIRSYLLLELGDYNRYYQDYFSKIRPYQMVKLPELRGDLDDFENFNFKPLAIAKIIANAYCRPVIFFQGSETLHILPCRNLPSLWADPFFFDLSSGAFVTALCFKKNGNPLGLLRLISPNLTENFWDHILKKDLYEYFNKSAFYSSVEMVPPALHCTFMLTNNSKSSFRRK